MLRFKKKDFYECKSQIFEIEDCHAGCGDRVAVAGKGSMRHGDDFDWFGGHSVKKEAQEVISRNHRAETPYGVSAPSPLYSTMITLWHCYNKNKT